MREIIKFTGIVLALQGVSGTIDHLFVQPFMGIFLNFFNRVIVPRVGFLAGYELFANLTVAITGIVLVIAAERTRPT